MNVKPLRPPRDGARICTIHDAALAFFSVRLRFSVPLCEPVSSVFSVSWRCPTRRQHSAGYDSMPKYECTMWLAMFVCFSLSNVTLASGTYVERVSFKYEWPETSSSPPLPVSRPHLSAPPLPPIVTGVPSSTNASLESGTGDGTQPVAAEFLLVVVPDRGVHRRVLLLHSGFALERRRPAR